MAFGRAHQCKETELLQQRQHLDCIEEAVLVLQQGASLIRQGLQVAAVLPKLLQAQQSTGAAGLIEAVVQVPHLQGIASLVHCVKMALYKSAHHHISHQAFVFTHHIHNKNHSNVCQPALAACGASLSSRDRLVLSDLVGGANRQMVEWQTIFTRDVAGLTTLCALQVTNEMMLHKHSMYNTPHHSTALHCS